MNRTRKALLASVALVGTIFMVLPDTASAGWGYGYNRYGGYYGSGYRGYNRGYGYGHGQYGRYYPSYGGVYHDTSHYDYHPGEFVRHRNHYHYQPGHYDYHQTGHWHY